MLYSVCWKASTVLIACFRNSIPNPPVYRSTEAWANTYTDRSDRVFHRRSDLLADRKAARRWEESAPDPRRNFRRPGPAECLPPTVRRWLSPLRSTQYPASCRRSDPQPGFCPGRRRWGCGRGCESFLQMRRMPRGKQRKTRRRVCISRRTFYEEETEYGRRLTWPRSYGCEKDAKLNLDPLPERASSDKLRLRVLTVETGMDCTMQCLLSFGPSIGSEGSFLTRKLTGVISWLT
jgi:hypothetical protein